MTESQSLAGPLLVYNPHPQFNSKVELLISYNTSKSLDLLSADAYRPRFRRVKIKGLR